MELERWLPIYDQICSDFGYDQTKDLESARKLASMLGARGSRSLESFRKTVPETVLVCGGGPGLADELSSMTIDGFVVAADSATSVLSDSGIRVDMIVTDLDGIVEDQIELNARGAAAFVHAHGDNQGALSSYVPKFTGEVIGTCQCRPPEGLVNFGGFTDGDRAACICAALGAKTITLAGFDFENPSDKRGRNKDVKRRKLQWAKRILEELERDGVRVRPATDRRENR